MVIRENLTKMSFAENQPQLQQADYRKTKEPRDKRLISSAVVLKVMQYI